MQNYVAPFETSLLFEADVAQRVEMILLYREFTGVKGVLLKCVWRSGFFKTGLLLREPTLMRGVRPKKNPNM